MEAEVRLEITQHIRTVTLSRETENVFDALRALSGYLGDSCSVRAEFCRVFYTPLLQGLVNGLSSDWFHNLPGPQRTELWDNFFLRGPPDQALLTLLDAITSSDPSAGLEHLVYVLEQFLSTGCLEVLLWSRCEGRGMADSLQVREVLLGRLVGLPTLTANKLQTKTPPAFMPQQYCTHLANTILSVLEKTCKALRGGQDCSLGFVGQVLGKACAQGHTALLFRTLAPRLSAHTLSDALWRRVSVKLLENIPDRWMEAVVTGLVQAVNGPETLSRIMGNIVLKNPKAKFVITHKFLLLQYHHKDCVLRTLLGYLAQDEERRPLLAQVLRALCQAWSNSSAVKHTTVEQQLYVSKALLLALSLMKPPEIEQQQEVLRQCMLSGMQCHLDSSVLRVRRIGMVVGESISQHMDTATARLSFQYEHDDETKALLEIMKPAEIKPEPSPEPEVDVKSSPEPGRDMRSSSPPHPSKPAAQPDSDLDSDDELTPYDMSADEVQQKCPPPRYLRDCLDGLLTSEDPERVSACLQAADGLVRRHVSTTKEVSVDFSKVLLHMEDKYSNPSFLFHRQRAMVALAVTDPVPVAEYLTTEFYSLNYNLRQRLDMLEVIALTAQELSQPVSNKSVATSAVALVTPLEPMNDLKHWRQVVDERIKSKTRRFCKGPSQPPPKASPSLYAPVAGYFFFPLLKSYDRPQVTFDLMGSDHLVLAQLLSTLGLLMHLAIHAPVATQMGKALLDFVWALRFHCDQSVRRGVLMCVCAVFLAMPSQSLLQELSEDLMDTRAWLAEVAETDVDADCRNLAVQCLVLQERSLKKELNAETQK
ncbi:telomere length regulation protein TEL2 homolog [Sardina pilchardus]|uniref:telomere length regulation protein TEL2 homolog n=1 Tax=Sardina pilchardus TaxID=27697 RepID=UPI002E0FC2CB